MQAAIPKPARLTIAAPFRPRPAFENGPRCISYRVEPRHACGTAVGGEDLPVVGDHAGDARKSLQRCDVLARIVIDHLDAIACTVRNEHAARSGVERGVVKRLDDDPLSGSLRVPVSSH
jgi:hypothetical protein